jgi:hypothetical protein
VEANSTAVAVAAVEIDLDKKFDFFNCRVWRCNLFILKVQDENLLTDNNTRA